MVITYNILICVKFRYYDQFSALNRKVPFRETGGVHVTFTWKDALEKGSLFSGTSKICKNAYVVVTMT